MRRIASWIALLCSAPLAQAATLQALSMSDLAQKSTDIAYVKVLDSYGSQHGSLIYTHYRVQILDTWKGAGKFSEVMLPGGVANGYRQTIAGSPALAEGQSYLMFLWAGPVGAPQLTGLTQGLFAVSTGKTGATLATRFRTTEQLLDANGNAVQDQPMSLDMKQLRRMVSQFLPAGKGSN